MKNKPTRHKDLNTFKFQPFAERISNIDVDIFHRVGHENETEEDSAECYFHQSMENWSILNLTEGFNDFKKEVKPYTLVTLPQLILDKDRVVEVLLKHLRLKNPLSLQPLLDVVVAVAKDLRKNFYQYYKDFLEVLIQLLNTKDTDQLEWTFTCLAYLFKFLWRPLLKDITTVFNTLLPLLSNSRPDYINNFAASSFSFVARKVKDWPTFLSHILKTVKSRKDGVDGCGKLFFEVVHGVAGHFHSCATTVLPFFLESLGGGKFSQNVLFEILEKVIENVVANIHPQKGALLWECLTSRVRFLLVDFEKSKAEHVGNEVELVLRLLGQSVECKGGKFLQNYPPIVALISDMLSKHQLPESLLQTTVKIAIVLLLSRNVKLTQEQASTITRKVLSLPQESILLYFVSNVAPLPTFDILILPTFLSICVKSGLNNDVLKVLSELVLKKAPLSGRGVNMHQWYKYPINFGNKSYNLAVETIFLKHLNDSDFECYMASLICLPHLNLTQTERIESILNDKISEFLLKLEKEKDVESDLCKSLFLLNSTIECLIHLKWLNYLNDNFDNILNTLMPLIVKQYVAALNTVDLLITVLNDRPNVINMATLQKLTNLSRGFTSPHHEIRLVTAHIYSLFEDLPEFDLRHSSDPDVPKEKFQIFSICYRIESIDSQVHTYRDQLQNLERLNFDKPQMIMCLKTDFRTIPLRYLCGALYINFKLLWEPISKIIETHAHGLEIGVFWEVFGEELKNVVGKNRGGAVKEEAVLDAKWECLNELYKKSTEFKSEPDFGNYRLLLWKAMDSFADVAEAKTRDVAELFLDFIENEYTRSNSLAATKWNIKENSADPVDDGIEEVNQEAQTTQFKHTNGKANLKLLLSSLSVFSKVRSPKSMYREPELNKLYHDFLQHKNAEIQKSSLNCIMTYKHKFLTPYKDHLYNLVDDKNFKNELSTFQIDKESGTIEESHRNDLVPLIMRIVFSKMSTKTGLRTGGKASGQLRRNLVFRFLAGCQEKEMLTFMKMALWYYAQYVRDDPEEMIEKLDLSPQSFMAPKRLQSSINLINVILDQFGGLMGTEVLTFLLQVVLVIGGAVKVAFDQISEVHSGYFLILRNLRTSTIQIIARFFGQFDRYPWTSKQINAVFGVFVWPYLNKLNTEGIHSPTTLLKLFVQWGTNPRYFSLLVKHEAQNSDQFVLPHVIRLLLNTKSKITVINVIEDMIEKLITLQADEEDLQMVVPVDNLVPIAKNILDRVKIDDKLNYGSCILLPYVPSILEKIQRQLQKKKSTLNQKELFILSRISELVWEPDISDSTLKLLLPQLVKRCPSGEETMTRLLTTVNNLVGLIDDPRSHLKQITPLFGEIGFVSGRKQLTHTLKIMGNDLEMSLVHGLNAFDTKWIDQPDFQKRHDTFKDIQKSLESEEIDLELGILLIYNCYYLLKSEKDLSLKENSSHCLKSLCPYLIRRFPKQIDYILNETVLTLIRKGMKSKNYDFRNECILILGHLARECPDSHVVLRDLNLYTNKIDPEVDFFENLTHLQLHRHARALLKFCSVTKELTTSLNVRTLTQFILPLTSFYLCNERYMGKNSVIDASIECIGVVCKILPWHQYEGLLKFYLSRLKKNVEYQKQLVRIMVTILDAFHYDLSKAQGQEDGETEKSGEPPKVAEATEEKAPEVENLEVDSEDVQAEEVADEDDAENEEDALEEMSMFEDEEDQDEEEEDTETPQSAKITEKVPVLCKSTATRVTRSIQCVLLPQLHKALAQFTQHETSHKVNRKKTGFEREEEDLLRVPISLALVKLLQRLPKEILDANLPGIFMKLCTFLKSHLESVRRVTRETLQKIMLGLGPEYLHLLLGEMTPLLNRGFHVHVLVFTVHAVLSCLKPMYKPTDIDKILLTVVQLCQADLFGSLSEEKGVTKIGVKTSEAKSTKSFDTFEILAKFVTDKCLMDLVLPIRNVLQSSHSFETVNKAEECLRHIVLGLVDNEFVSPRSLLTFAYGSASESIPELVPQEKEQISDKEREKLKRRRVDCFIIPKAPVGRGGVRVCNVKSSMKTNAHLLVQFGLRLCHVLLKRDKLKDDDYKPYLDPFVAVFQKCLTSKHVKLTTLTLQCLTWLLKYELPSLQTTIKTITEDIFALLHKFGSAGLSKGDNFDLVMAAFKAVSVLVRDVKYHTIDVEQLKILLLYSEQDIDDHNRQATAFNLLKAIIARKLIVPEIYEVMAKVAELSITSELNHVRAQSRVVFHQYLMDYPLGERLEKHVSFYLQQLSYDVQFGRESAIEMIGTLISTFPMKTLKDHSGTMFLTLSARLVNDEIPECRKRVAECLTSLLSRLEKKERQNLFDLVAVWFRDSKLDHKRLAAQVCGLFVTIEKSSFETRLRTLLPVIIKQFTLKRDEDSEEEQSTRDHHLFQVLQMLLKMCTHCASFFKMKDVDNLHRHVQALLGYPHDWVRLAAAQYLGFVLAAIDVGELAALMTDSESSRSGYLRENPIKEVKSLTLDLCDQLQPDDIKSDLAEQVIKNLVFVARVLEKVPKDAKVTLLWLTIRMCKIVNSEVVKRPTSIILRREVFKWIAAVTTVLEPDTINSVVRNLLAPLIREMITTDESDAPLRQLSKEVGLLLKKKVGLETYTQTLSSLQQHLSTKKADRKRKRTQLAVTDPEVFAQKKIKRNEKKKEAKKRKIEKFKGKKTFKKRKVVDLEPADEVM